VDFVLHHEYDRCRRPDHAARKRPPGRHAVRHQLDIRLVPLLPSVWANLGTFHTGILKKVFPLCAICLLWAACAFPQAQQHWAAAWQGPAAANVAGIPTNLINYAIYWWHAGDLPNGVTVSNQWHDRIQNAAMGSNTGAPTNGPCGVFFNGTSDSLAFPGGGVNINIHCSMMFIIKRESAGDATYQLWWDANPPNADANGWRLVSRSAWNQKITSDALIDLKGTAPADTYIDLLIASTNNPTSVTFAYTNGVATSIQSDSAGSTIITPAQLGAAFNGASVDNHFQGCITDVIIWTNLGGSHNFNWTDISNTHYYAKQIYGVTP
jgi:hypothetical protein